MRKWLYDNPWIWIVLFLATLIAGRVAPVIIAELNKPEIVRPKEPRRGGSHSSLDIRADREGVRLQAPVPRVFIG